MLSVQNSKSCINIEDGIEEYWLSVALKKRELLDQVFAAFKIYDFENKININIHNSVGTTIPKSFINRLLNITRYIQATNREEFSRISHERLRQLKSKTKHEDERKIIYELDLKFCSSNSFLKFIKIDQPFIYKESIQGESYYETIPFDVFPKSMNVIVTTSIDFNNPTSQGKLYFNRNKFENEINEFFNNKGFHE